VTSEDMFPPRYVVRLSPGIFLGRKESWRKKGEAFLLALCPSTSPFPHFQLIREDPFGRTYERDFSPLFLTNFFPAGKE